MSDIKLKPCPFCGDTGSICVEPWDFEKKCPGENYKYVVECDLCLARTDEYETREKAAEAWNRRCAESVEKTGQKPMRVKSPYAGEPSRVKAFDGGDKVVTYLCYPCPNCRKWIHANKNDTYCPHCGQKLDWSGVK